MSTNPIPSSLNLNEDERKHLEFIQNIITRMNSNSFTIKGWAVTIVAALLAVFASTKNVAFLAVSILPIFIFWWLDAKYLQMERKYRSLFNAVASKSQNISLYDLDANKQFINNEEKNNLKSSLKADTIRPFYLLLALLTLASIVTIFILREPKEDKVVNTRIIGEVTTKSVDTSKKTIIEPVIPTPVDAPKSRGKKTPTSEDGPKTVDKKATTPIGGLNSGSNKLATPIDSTKIGA